MSSLSLFKRAGLGLIATFLMACPAAPKPDPVPVEAACVIDAADPWAVAQAWAAEYPSHEALLAPELKGWSGAALLRVWRDRAGEYRALVGSSSEQEQGDAALLVLGAGPKFEVLRVEVSAATTLWPSLQ